jgi:hypothetical protein
VKKQIQKPSSPAAHPREKEEQCRSKRHHFRLLLFFYGDPKMGYNNIVCINSKHSS